MFKPLAFRSHSLSSAVLLAVFGAAIFMPLPGRAADEPAATKPLVTFAKQRLDEWFFAEGAGVGDFNKDGVRDIVAGPFWFAGPAFTERHAFYDPKLTCPHSTRPLRERESRAAAAKGGQEIPRGKAE